MRIVLHAGHGLTPPGDYGYCRWTRSGRKRPAPTGWHYQRGWQKMPDGSRWIEDEATAEFCSQLIPELVKQGHEVYPMRAMDPVTGELDRRRVSPQVVLPGLSAIGDELGEERWKYCGAVEAALRQAHGKLGAVCPPWRWRYRGSYDPAAMLFQERIQDADLYLSVHFNWYPVRKMYGFSTHHHPGSRRGKTLAGRIYRGVLQGFDGDPWTEKAKLPWGRARIADGCRWGIYSPRLWELFLSRAPAVVLELAFASNPGDISRITDPAWRARMAESIAASVGI